MHRLLMLTGLFAAAVSGCYCGPGQVPGPGNSDGTITIDNASGFVITEIRVTPVNSRNWGPNLLADVLFPGEQITVRVACDTYDVLVADEFARDCILGPIDLCFSDELWAIDNYTLRSCGF